MENKKTIFWIIGVPCSGKSYYAVKLSDKLKIPFLHLDCAYDYPHETREEKAIGYKALFNRTDARTFIINGIIPYSHKDDMDIMKEVLKDARVIYILVTPSYKQYLSNVSKRVIEDPTIKSFTKDEYASQQSIWYRRLGIKHLSFNDLHNIDQITDEDIRSLDYQHFGFTDKKWTQLQVDCKGKSVLDLGCSSCYYEKFAMKDGAIKYTGLDVNMAYLTNPNAYKFDLNYLEYFHEEVDIVISTSVYHYIGDKEKFIREVSRLTKDTFIFEIPLSKLSGRLIECEPNRHLLLTTKELTEFWINKYFKSFSCLGRSIVEDGSYRLIYHCKK